jgi:hypothetical protein
MVDLVVFDMVHSLSTITTHYHYERSIPCRNLMKNACQLAQNLLSKICAKTIEFVREIAKSQDFINRHRQNPTDFTRERKLPVLSLISFLLSLLRGSYQKELDRFFHILGRSEAPKRVVTKAAFAKARMKLKYQAFVELNHSLLAFFENHFSVKTWNGFRLLAADGSTVRLPHADDIQKHFGSWKVRQGKPSPMARVSQLFDTLNKITVDAIISPKHIGERELAAGHFLNLKPTDLVLMDRGYPAWWLFALVMSMGAQFCARISKRRKIVQSFLASGEKERLIFLPVSSTSVKTARQLGLDIKPLKLRLIRIDNSQDKPLILITSLTDTGKHPYPAFSDLYHSRWPVEEDYKVIKSRIELENFSGKSALSVYQDFHAKVLMKNIVSIFALPVNDMLAEDKAEGRKHDYQVNLTHALATSKDLIPLLFQRSKTKIKLIIEALFELLRRTLEPIRPGRRYPRKHRVSVRKYFACYKPIS